MKIFLIFYAVVFMCLGMGIYLGQNVENLVGGIPFIILGFVLVIFASFSKVEKGVLSEERK